MGIETADASVHRRVRCHWPGIRAGQDNRYKMVNDFIKDVFAWPAALAPNQLRNFWITSTVHKSGLTNILNKCYALFFQRLYYTFFFLCVSGERADDVGDSWALASSGLDFADEIGTLLDADG